MQKNLSKNQRVEDKIEELEKVIQDRVSKAITNEILKNKSDYSLLIKDNRRFKEDVQKEVKRLKRQNERLESELIDKIKKETESRFHKWNSALGAIKTNGTKKLHEVVGKEEKSRIDSVNELRKTVRSNHEFSKDRDVLASHRLKMTLVWLIIITVLTLIGVAR